MGNLQVQDNHSLINYDTDSAEAIEFRRIFSKIKSLSNSHLIQNVMITSSINGEGKTTISTFLAITCSRYSNGKTLLIDCDLRRPKIHKMLNVKREIGLAAVLRDEIDPLHAVKDTGMNNLKVITSGRTNGDPSTLLNLNKIKDVFTQLQWIFHTIIIDTPPIIPVNDTLILNAVADTTLMVIKAGKTQKEVVKRAVELIQDAGAKNMGLLVNNLNNVLPYYYSYKYYGKKYRNIKKQK